MSCLPEKNEGGGWGGWGSMTLVRFLWFVFGGLSGWASIPQVELLAGDLGTTFDQFPFEFPPQSTLWATSNLTFRVQILVTQVVGCILERSLFTSGRDGHGPLFGVLATAIVSVRVPWLLFSFRSEAFKDRLSSQRTCLNGVCGCHVLGLPLKRPRTWYPQKCQAHFPLGRSHDLVRFLLSGISILSFQAGQVT